MRANIRKRLDTLSHTIITMSHMYLPLLQPHRANIRKQLDTLSSLSHMYLPLTDWTHYPTLSSLSHMYLPLTFSIYCGLKHRRQESLVDCSSVHGFPDAHQTVVKVNLCLFSETISLLPCTTIITKIFWPK